MSSEFRPDNSACNPAAVGNNTAKIHDIPDGINYFATPGVNTSDPWMETCCRASTVHLADVCWLWCEMDPAIISSTPMEEPFPRKLGLDFMECMVANGRDLGGDIGALVYYEPPTESETQSQPNESQAQPQPTESALRSPGPEAIVATLCPGRAGHFHGAGSHLDVMIWPKL
jgi:hypothetical protein